MVSWFADGNVSGFNPASGGLNQFDRYLLATGGCVDVNGTTRLQYNTSQILSAYDDRLVGIARLNYNPSDISLASTLGHNLTASMYIVDASRFSGTPTTTQVLADPTAMIYRSGTRAISNGETVFFIYGPRSSSLSPGTKYWVVVLPTKIPGSMSLPNSYANDHPFGSDSLQRGLSIWTNRPPSAPVITSPVSGYVGASGGTVSLSYTPGDADAVSGGTTKVYRDLAGVQFQYRPRPTVSAPNPSWSDLPIANGSNTLRPGWYIDGAASNGQAIDLWNSQAVTLRFGTSAANQAYLPSGDWQIRCRTFDYGHPWPTNVKPLANTAGTYTPSTYPSSNTSPWSDPITVTIPAQCPPPIPLSPINDLAYSVDQPITLKWRFRNTATPPFTQQSRTVQIRVRNDPAGYTTLVSGNSSSQQYTITGYPLLPGVNYEWRVLTGDTGGATSSFSEPATFWMVAAPGSGDVRPLPSETTDGATLGCGKHRAFVYRRGGKVRVGEITDIVHLDWARVRDDISDAQVEVANWGVDCGVLLSKLQTWAYELVIYRDNGYSVDRVWEGPITRLTYEQSKVTIHARDVMVYAYRRIIKQKMSDAGTGNGTSVVDRARRVLQNSMADDDPNILPYLTVLTDADDSIQYRSTPAYSRTAFEEIDDMAANAGLDYTAVGRSILLWGTRRRIGTLPEFRDEDLGAVPIVSEYGMSMANVYAVSDGNGIAGTANRLDVSGNDPVYGRVEMLSSSWASDSPIDTGTYTQEGINTIINSFKEYAERSIEDRYPPPVVVRIPDNTTLNPGAVISIQHLVPGVVIPLRSSGTLRTVRGNQKLDSVKVVEEAGTETISITLSPFNRDDNALDTEE